MTEGGPYKALTVDTGPYKLSLLKKEITKMNKYSVPLPENIREGEILPLFKNLIEIESHPRINALDIVLYSVTTGILKYADYTTINETILDYRYINEEKPSIKLTVRYNKNLGQATIISVSGLEV